MAKLSSVNKNNYRAELNKRQQPRRQKLKDIIMDKDTSMSDRFEAVQKLAKMPRNGAAIRYRNRCELTGRPRGVYRKFKLARIKLRELASAGMIPGMTKSSW